MSLLFYMSLALFLVAEMISVTRIVYSSFSVRKLTLAVWCLVPLFLVSILLWNHADLFDGLRDSKTIAFLLLN